MNSKVMILAILMIVLNVFSSEAASITHEYVEFPASTHVLSDICPTLGSAEYQISVLGSNTAQIGGCAYTDFKISNPRNKTFSLWLGSLYFGKPLCRENGMDHFHFPCLPDISLPLDNSTKGSFFVQLYGQLTKKENRPKLRCAMYEMGKGNATQFHMAISKDDSCHGLSDLLTQPHPMIPDGTILMRMTRTRYQLRLRRSQSTSKDSDKYLYSGSRFYWRTTG